MSTNRIWKTTSIISMALAVLLVVMVILVNTTGLKSATWLRVLFGISALNFTLRAAVPLILGALSGILCERSGIINIGIEGMMLAGASWGLYFVALRSRSPSVLWQNVEMQGYWLVIWAAVAVATLMLFSQGVLPDVWTSMRQAAFNVVSVAPTPGFASVDY